MSRDLRMTQIDPLSFFSSTGVKEVKPATAPAARLVPELKPTAPSRVLPVSSATSKRPLEESTNLTAAGDVQKRVKLGDVKCMRMPGVTGRLIPPVTPSATSSTPLWVDKYKPKKISDLVGNQQQISKLGNWVRNWDPTHQSVRPGMENLGAKAALLSGTAGIGKTSTARLICEAAGFHVLEFNASDTRSKNVIDEMANGLATNNVLGTTSGGSRNGGMGSKVVIIMDEVDGMSGGDRGGSAALIQMIKKSKLPIICICNDRQDNKIRSLANHCFDLRFQKPTREEVAGRAQFVARCEGMKNLSYSEFLEIAESSSCDMRQVINQLQLIHTSGKTASTCGACQKDESMDPFTIVKGLFTSATARSWDYAKRNELFFMDYDLIPLLVQQNYVKCVEKVVDPRVLPALYKANEYICLGDVISRAIHTDAHWGLLPELGTISTVAPSFACNNALGFPEFPAWLGRMSTQGKNARLMKELRNMIGSTSTTTSRNLKLSGYSDVLYETLVGRLRGVGNDTNAIQSTIELIDELGVPKDALFEVLAETRFSWQQDPYATVDSKTKAALTRSYNSRTHIIKAGASLVPGSKKAGAPVSVKRTSEDGENDELEDNDEQRSPEDENDAKAAGLVKPAKASGKNRKK